MMPSTRDGLIYAAAVPTSQAGLHAAIAAVLCLRERERYRCIVRCRRLISGNRANNGRLRNGDSVMSGEDKQTVNVQEKKPIFLASR